ncbi:hypothetical protein E4U42_003288 [Claviceps africana]|uniref:CMP/dCMP-type deaminase domain-containing protein n=1 Tax=Claviceps africana TaxID=83212 RepID=A0A8K0J7H0_9HYPO|nr:hypothetical protein E4U42_003288 [Claviceps africana]
MSASPALLLSFGLLFFCRFPPLSLCISNGSVKHLSGLAVVAFMALAFQNAFGLGDDQAPLVNNIRLSTRHHWMRQANEALLHVRGTPCPFNAFGSVIVNHTAGGLGEMVCIGANDIASGNPTIHGEIAAINNCSAILTDPDGPYRLTGGEAQLAWADLSLYTNAEPCSMCASAIRWAGFKELVFGSSTADLEERGWPMISLSAEALFGYATGLGTETAILKRVLSNETDVYFGWQFDAAQPCPAGCQRAKRRCQKMDL